LTKIDTKKKKKYILDMFPYPSGEGLHVGHPKGYIATDIYSRLKRMQGFNVLRAMGWDAFGLPAEQYAIKMKMNPVILTKKNVARYKQQLELMGLNYDWNREIDTTDPDFYKWTQWIFKQLYKAGLCHESFEPINWCPSCKTGLANEDLEDGKCERCGSVVEKKPIRQWVIKITDYAEKLLSGLDEVAWKENIKDMQRNWIGKSEGININYKVKDSDKILTVFTTRPDTNFGATFIVTAPDGKFVEENMESFPNKEEVKKYVIECKNKSEIERVAVGRKKTGVNTGLFAINNLTNKEMPIYVGDFALGNVGTGNVVCVPGHDLRDFEFAVAMNLPIIRVVVGDDGDTSEITKPEQVQEENGTMINSGFLDGENIHVATKKIIEYIAEKGWGEKVVNYKLRDWVFARQRYWGEPFPIVFDENHKAFVVADKELPVVLPNVKSYEPTGTGESPLANIKSFTDVYGFINKDGEFESVEGLTSKKELKYFGKGNRKRKKGLDLIERKVVDVIITDGQGNYFILKDKNGNTKFVGGGIEKGETEIEAVIKEVKEETGFKDFIVTKKFPQKITYQGYHDNKNINVICPGYFYEVIINSEKRGKSEIEEGKHEMLKLTKEEVLKKLSFEWHTFAFKSYLKNKFIKISKFTRETNTMPQWAGSSWYWLRYMDPKNKKALVDKKIEKYWGQVDLYCGGMEHATRHLIYGRFWNRFLYDIKAISTKEPFNRLEGVGLIMASDGRKMSKRYGNVINPDDVIGKFGADTFRLYEMFMGAFHDTVAWSEDGIVGPRRFIERIWAMQYRTTTPSLLRRATPSKEGEFPTENEKLETILHQTIKKVGEDYEKLSFNTAISQMMIFANVLEQTTPSNSSNLPLPSYQKGIRTFRQELYKSRIL
jgi:leucyl-tRNA synthetase